MPRSLESSLAMPESSTRRRVLLQEADFAEALGARGVEFASLGSELLAGGAADWGERRYYLLYRLSTELETFLDDHGARANATFFRIREAVAVARWLSLAASALSHLEARLSGYVFEPANWPEEALRMPLQSGLAKLNEYLAQSVQGIREEWVRAGAEWIPGDLADAAGESLAALVLPADRDQHTAATGAESSQAARFVGRYLRFVEVWAAGARKPAEGPEELRRFMEEYCRETTARRFEAKAHNLQSEYDSVLAGSPELAAHPDLVVLRSAVSLCLHLLEAATALTHLYERHDVHERHGDSRALFERLVDVEGLLNVVVNLCVTTAYACLKEAAPVAERLLPALTLQEERMLQLPDGIQMHARPVSMIVRVVAHHGTPVEMACGTERASAASMMSMLVLIGGQPDARSFLFRGDRAALDDLELLFAAGLAERGLDQLPSALDYLK